MEIDNDVITAKKILYGQIKYKKIKIFPSNSLKHFKNYKLENKNVLTKINSIDEVFDLLSYNSKVICFSNNMLDKYFIKLLLTMHNYNRKQYLNFIFKDFQDSNIFSKEIYQNIRKDLDDETRYFFDELYKTKNDISDLIEKQKYPKEILEMYIKGYLSKSYENIKNNNEIVILNLTSDQVVDKYKNNTFDFINLSYNINNDNIKDLLKREKRFISLLKENGKIQGFISQNNIEIPNHKINETRSILDPYTPNNICKKEYSYVYKKSQQEV